MDDIVSNLLLHYRIDPEKPIYEQFFEQIRFSIARGELESNAQLPSVRKLAAHLRVNPTTIMKTYKELEQGGLIMTRRGQGTFVTADKEKVEQCKREIAIGALDEVRKTADSLGMSLEEMIALANNKGGN